LLYLIHVYLLVDYKFMSGIVPFGTQHQQEMEIKFVKNILTSGNVMIYIICNLIQQGILYQQLLNEIMTSEHFGNQKEN